MTININEMFDEKNQSLFINNLIVNLDNNTDTFKLTVKNIIMIEIAKLLSSLKKIYDKYDVEFTEEKLKELLNSTKKDLFEDIGVVIENRKTSNKEYIEKEPLKINKTYLKGYHKHIDETENTFEGVVNIGIKEDTDVKLYESLISLYPSKNEEMHFDVLKTINMDFTNTLISRVVEENKHRNKTLKNMSEATYEKYLELSKNSSLMTKDKKVYIKKEN